MHARSPWIQAARPLAAANVLVPLLLGQALAFAAHGRFSWTAFAAIQLFGFFDQLFIVFANDFADQEADALNDSPTFVSGGSRVIQEGLIPPAALRAGAWVMLGAQMAIALALALGRGLWWMPVLVLLGAALLWAYSYPPLRLSYRGYGETLQGLGVGVLLPVIGFYAQAGSFEGMPLLGLIPCFVLGYVGNLLTSLPDYAADKAAAKLSYAVRVGQYEARRHSLELLVLSSVFGFLVVPGLPVWGLAPIIVAPLIPVYFALRLLGSADAANQGECLRFVILAASASNLAMLGWILASLIQGWLHAAPVGLV